MLSVWVSLAVSVALVAVTGVQTGRLGWRTFKDTKRLTGGLGRRLEALSRSAAQLERSAAAIESSSVKLERSLARLAASRRRLAVLTGALDEVQDTLARVSGFFPRK
jgi:hypothetical protein